MTSREIYKRFLLQINKNDTNEGINIPISHFVLIFNTESLKYVTEELKENADNNKINYLKPVFIVDKELVKDQEFSNSVTFKLPSEFLKHAGSYSIVSSKDCNEGVVYNFEKNPLNYIVNLADNFNNPSLEYRETFFLLTKDKYQVYFDDFEIKKVFMSYYKEPGKIDIAGYTKIDGTPSVDKDTDLDDSLIESVISRMSLEVIRQYQDQNSIVFAKDRVQTEP